MPHAQHRKGTGVIEIHFPAADLGQGKEGFKQVHVRVLAAKPVLPRHGIKIATDLGGAEQGGYFIHGLPRRLQPRPLAR